MRGYSEIVAAKLRKTEVLKDNVVFSVSYEGNVLSGSVKFIKRDTETNIADYDRAAGMDITSTATFPQYITLNLDKDKAINEIVDGFVAANLPDGVLADRLDSAGYQLAMTVDNDGGAKLLSQGTREDVTIDETNTAYDVVVDIRTKLSKIGVPNDGRRYLLVTPDFYARLLKDPNFIGASTLGDEIRETGCIGKIAGFNVYEWNNDTENLLFVAGHPAYAVRAREFSVPVKVVDLDGDSRFIGAVAIKGRVCYAHAVTQPLAIRCVYEATV
jgi:hypothetical protein